MEENQSFLSSIVTLKVELKEAKNQFEELTKSVKMLINEMQWQTRSGFYRKEGHRE